MDKYKCWDCGQEIQNVDFDEETKGRCPMDLQGYKYIICDDCKDNDEY